MNRLLSSFIFLFLPLLAVSAYGQEQVNGSSTVTFGLGAGKATNSYSYAGPQLNGSYEYRIGKYLSFEFGVDSTFVSAPVYTTTISSPVTILTGVSTGTYIYSSIYSTGTSRATTMPFGFRGVLPLAQGRIEVGLGAGGVYLFDPSDYYYGSSGWGWQGNLFLRMAVDKKRRFWLGSTGRYMDARGNYPGQWVVWSADLGYRFGGH